MLPAWVSAGFRKRGNGLKNEDKNIVSRNKSSAPNKSASSQKNNSSQNNSHKASEQGLEWNPLIGADSIAFVENSKNERSTKAVSRSAMEFELAQWKSEVFRKNQLQNELIAKYRKLYEEYVKKSNEVKTKEAELNRFHLDMKAAQQKIFLDHNERLERSKVLETQLAEKVQALTQQNKQLTLHNSIQNRQISELNERYRSLSGVLANKDKIVGELRLSVSSLVKENEMIKLDLKTEKSSIHETYKDQILDLKLQNKKLREEFEVVQHQLAQSQADRDRSHQRADELAQAHKQSLETAHREKENLEFQNLSLNSEINYLRDQVQDTDQKLRDYVQSADTIELNNKKLSAKLRDLTQEANALKENLNLKNQALEKALDENAKLSERQNSENTKATSADLEERLNALEQKISAGKLNAFIQKLHARTVVLKNQLGSEDLLPSYRKQLEDQCKYLDDILGVVVLLQQDLQATLLEAR